MRAGCLRRVVFREENLQLTLGIEVPSGAKVAGYGRTLSVPETSSHGEPRTTPVPSHWLVVPLSVLFVFTVFMYRLHGILLIGTGLIEWLHLH